MTALGETAQSASQPRGPAFQRQVSGRHFWGWLPRSDAHQLSRQDRSETETQAIGRTVLEIARAHSYYSELQC